MVAFRFLPPQLDHGAQAFGFGGGEVARLGRILGDVVQLPLDGVEAGLVGLDGVERHGLPAVLVQRAAAEHLEVLHAVAIGRVGRAERLGEADPVDRCGRRDARELQHGREDVDRVHELIADPARRRDITWPGHDERIGDTAFVDLAFHRRNGVLPATVQPHG